MYMSTCSFPWSFQILVSFVIPCTRKALPGIRYRPLWFFENTDPPPSRVFLKKSLYYTVQQTLTREASAVQMYREHDSWTLVSAAITEWKVLGTFVGLKMLHTHMANKDVYIETEEKRTSVISTLDILTTQLSGITARTPWTKVYR